MMSAVRRTVLLVSLVLRLVFAGSATAAGAVYFAGAAGGRHVKPRTLELSGDGTLEVFKVHWSSWGATTAGGRGQAEYHGCTPNCAAATDRHARVSIQLSRVRRCGSRSYYSHVRLTLPSGKLLDRGFLRISWKPC
jgi:hypothetical protein